MSVTNPATLAKLAELGCVDDGKVNPSKIAAVLAEKLEAAHIADSPEQVSNVEVPVGTLAKQLLDGDEDAELIDTIRPLLSSGAKGKVQLALSDGYVLCAGRVPIDVMIDGELRRTSVTTRFLSANHDVVQRYALDPRIKKAESAAQSNIALRDLIAIRQPDMAPRLVTFVEQLEITWQRALGSGQ